MIGKPRLKPVANRHANTSVHGTGVLHGRKAANYTGRHEHEKNSDHGLGKVSHLGNIANNDFLRPRNSMRARGIALKKVGEEAGGRLAEALNVKV